tara:strand:- start:181 stop:567 length:387 start_codon:yes stop_codon:yes gene_type:complete
VDFKEIIGEGCVKSIIESLKDGNTKNALEVSKQLLVHNKAPDMSNDVVDNIKMYLTNELVNLLDDKLKNNTLNDKTLDCIKEIANKNGVLQFHDYKAERELAKFYRDEYKKIPVRTHTKLQKPYMIKL